MSLEVLFDTNDLFQAVEHESILMEIFSVSFVLMIIIEGDSLKLNYSQQPHSYLDE